MAWATRAYIKGHITSRRIVLLQKNKFEPIHEGQIGIAKTKIQKAGIISKTKREPHSDATQQTVLGTKSLHDILFLVNNITLSK